MPRLHHLDLIEIGGKCIKIIQATASKWKQFATRLHFEPGDIECIRSDKPSQCYEACWEVCSQWLNGVGRKPTNWKTVIKVLKEIDLSEIALDLESIIMSDP